MKCQPVDSSLIPRNARGDGTACGGEIAYDDGMVRDDIRRFNRNITNYIIREIDDEVECAYEAMN